jgi:hypothetical protein
VAAGRAGGREDLERAAEVQGLGTVEHQRGDASCTARCYTTARPFGPAAPARRQRAPVNLFSPRPCAALIPRLHATIEAARAGPGGRMSEETFARIREVIRASDDVQRRTSVLLRRLDTTITHSRELLERIDRRLAGQDPPRPVPEGGQ